MTSLIAEWSNAAAPPPTLTISEWSDARRILPESSAARGEHWRTDAVPYLRGPMDALHEPGVELIAIMKAHQIGGSEALHNVVGYHVEHDPCPILFVHPTSQVADEWSKERLADMIRTTPALAAVISDKRKTRGSYEAESTLGLKMFPGGYLALGGANTPNTFARRAVRRAFGDDVDRWPPVVGDEGDPAELLINRLTTFYDGVAFFVSTPTLKGGRIDTLYQRSDRRRYFVTCPGCGRVDFFTWSGKCNDPTCGQIHVRVAFNERNPETARLQCPDSEHGGCGAHIDEPTRRRLISAGEWRPTAVSAQRGHVGFHLPAMLSTIGDVTIPHLVEKWLGARAKGKESLRVFINTSLAEGWEDRTVRLESNLFLARREAYGDGIEVPAAAVCLTAGVDTQDDRFELLVLAWGPSDERWVVDWRRIPGDPKLLESRAALLAALGRRYTHALGVQLPILATCVDTGGHRTEEMYEFVQQYQVRRIYATKGFGGRSGEPIVGKPSEKRYGKNPRPVALYPINSDDAKREIFASLNLNLVSTLDGTPSPGSTHFPIGVDTIDEEFFAQLCSEHLETKYNKGGVATHAVWVEDRTDNHSLDCMQEALAAKRLLNPNIKQMADLLAEAATQQAAERQRPAEEQAKPAATAQAPVPRTGRSKYLGG